MKSRRTKQISMEEAANRYLAILERQRMANLRRTAYIAVLEEKARAAGVKVTPAEVEKKLKELLKNE